MPKEYITIQGDMWDGIAKKTLGSEYYMSELIDANPDYRETVIFPAGVRLTIPEVSTPVPELLPPWKRGGS
jgi:phage tail protein X